MAKKPVVNLIGLDSNAFSIIGECHRAAKAAGWTTPQWNAVRAEMMNSDYENLLQVALHYFDVATPEDDDFEDDDDDLDDEDDDFDDDDDWEDDEDE